MRAANSAWLILLSPVGIGQGGLVMGRVYQRGSLGSYFFIEFKKVDAHESEYFL